MCLFIYSWIYLNYDYNFVIDPLGERVDVRYSTDNLASFIPHTSGYHRIYISDYHGPILGSPFYALIFPNTELNFSGHEYVESSGIRDSIRNEKSTFIIRDTDLNIDVQIKSNYYYYTLLDLN